MKPDILCLGETKIKEDQIKLLQFPKDYYNYYDCCIPPHAGYAGV